jgi:uncharacterized protein YjbI with pentapeptide repeats
MADETQPPATRPRVKMSQAELDAVIKRHEMYQAGRMGGQRALLSYRDLTGLNLAGKNLSDADFTASFLTDANLAGVNLNHAVPNWCAPICEVPACAAPI